MANFIGAIEQFNPYIQQIPIEAYTKVGMFKQQQYEAGYQKIQATAIDYIAGLDIANEGGKNYARNRVAELTKTLNKYNTVDFSNPNNVSQLIGLAKPLYQDTNIVNDVMNTATYRKWYKDATKSYQDGKMELGQFQRESSDAQTWLSSDTAGSKYTGRSTPNTATKKDLVDRIVKLKKDGLDKNEYVYDTKYSPDTPYYVKSTNRFLSEADFNNFISESVMTERDREMLMNGHWYENMGKSGEQLKMEDIGMYQSKIDFNNREIDRIKNDPNLYAGEKKAESEEKIKSLQEYNNKLLTGKMAFLGGLDPNDPQSRDVFHRDLAESRFMDSLGILRDETRKEELQKNYVWEMGYKAQLDAANEALKNSGKGTGEKGKEKKDALSLLDEVSFISPVNPNDPKTEVSLNVIKQGHDIANDRINTAMNSMMYALQKNKVDLGEFVAGWDKVNVGGKGGAVVSVPRFRNQAAKDKFYNMVAGINFAYNSEAKDGNLDNKDFREWVKTNMVGYNDEDVNSKFTLADKAISDGLNTMKGTSALLPKLEGLFSDKSLSGTLAELDEALKNKKDMANTYRTALMQSNSLNSNELKTLQTMTDDDLLSNNFFLDKDKEQARYGSDKFIEYKSVKESDGTYSVYQNVYKDDRNWFNKKIQDAAGTFILDGQGPLESRKLAGGFKDVVESENAIRTGGQLSLIAGISKESLNKAEKEIRQNFTYVQENINTSVGNLKNDKDAYAAVSDAIGAFLTTSKGIRGSNDIVIDNLEDPTSISGVKDVQIRTASVTNTQDIFNPDPRYLITFKAFDAEGKERSYDASISLKSFLATNPNYKTADYAKYFAPMLYAQKDAFARLKATINPLEGSEASYANRDDVAPVYNYRNQSGESRWKYDDVSEEIKPGAQNSGYQWESLPITKNGKQTVISYQVVSLGQDADRGNVKNANNKGDGQVYEKGAYYIKMKVPTSNGGNKVIFLKKPDGQSAPFQSASYAHYYVRDLLFNNPDMEMDEIDQATGKANYLTTNPYTIRGVLNSQLSYNGHSKLESIKLKDAFNREMSIQQAKEMQVAY